MPTSTISEVREAKLTYAKDSTDHTDDPESNKKKMENRDNEGDEHNMHASTTHNYGVSTVHSKVSRADDTEELSHL